MSEENEDTLAKGKKGDEDLLTEAREQFEECVNAERDNRIEALDDLKFARLGEQWPDKIKKQRETEGRPCLTLNRLPSFVRQVVNDARQNKPSIKVKPVDDSADIHTAKVLSSLIRNIEYTSDADVAYDTAIDFAASCGFGYLRVDMDYSHDDSFDMELKVCRVANPFSIYGDPFSRAADSHDWNRAFVVDSMEREEFKAKWKNAEEVDWEGLGYNNMGELWADGETIQIAEWWKREEVTRKIVLLSNGTVLSEEVYKEQKDYYDILEIKVLKERTTKSWKITQRIMTGAEILETNEWPGTYIPLIPVYGEEINVEGKRYFRSLIRDAKDPQRMFNYWRTTSTELVALAPRIPFVGPKGAFATDADKWATANTVSHPFIQYDGNQAPQRQPLDFGGAAGAMQEAMAASDDMKSIMGIFNASLGQQSNETSGRAIIARQHEGDVSTFHFIDNMTRAIRHTGRVLVDLIPHVYSGPRILRVLGEDGNSQNVPVNQPPQQMQPITPQGGSPDTQEAIQHMYDLSVGRYDVAVEAGPSYTTKREEASAQMTEFVRAYPQAAPIIGDLLAKNLDWPDAEKIAERFKALLPPQVAGNDPRVQQMQQAIQQLQQHLQAQTQELEQVKQDKFLEKRKLDIEAYGKETDRLKVTQVGMTTDQLQLMVLQTVQQLLMSPDILSQSAPQGVQPMPQMGQSLTQ